MLEEFPPEARSAAEHTVEHLYGNRRGVGFVISALNHSQVSYSLIHRTNEYLTNNPYDNISIFAVKYNPTAKPPLTGVFSSLDLKSYREPCVAVDPLSWQMSSISYRSKRFFYPYDPTLLEITNPDIVRNIAQKAIVICRTQEHAELLREKFDIVHSGPYVPEFDMETLTDYIWNHNA